MSLFCECLDWTANIAKVDAPFLLAAARNPGKGNYEGIPFRFCPWCGRGLKESVELRARSHPGPRRPDAP